MRAFLDLLALQRPVWQIAVYTLAIVLAVVFVLVIVAWEERWFR